MKISEILKREENHLSFEVFPPKTELSYASVIEAAERIASLSPSFLSVTYGAGGSLRGKNTLEVAKDVKRVCGVETLAHLTCVSSTKEGIRASLDEYKAEGIENVMALRGDYPCDCTEEDKAKWGYKHATELIADIKSGGYDFCVGGACYPEKHPESPDKAYDIEFLKRKTEAGCEFLTTQMFFDNDLFYNFLYRLRSAGVDVPVVAGIMPITSARQIERAQKLSGSFMPQRFLNLVDRFG